MALITGTPGNDRLSGTRVADEIDGGAGRDTITGGDGNDLIYTGTDSDADIAIGGSGNDYIKSYGAGDAVSGGDGRDKWLIFIEDQLDVLHLDFSKVHLDTPQLIGLGKTTASSIEVMILNKEIECGWGSSIRGTVGDDVIERVHILDIDGAGAALTLYGGLGNDVLEGSTKRDILRGGAGKDTLTGYYGVDTMFGDSGKDTFTLELFRGADRIGDFESGVDKLRAPDRGKFNSFGQLDRSDALASGSDPVRTTDGGQFLYDTDNGKLYYETNQGRELVAGLIGVPDIVESDFVFGFL